MKGLWVEKYRPDTIDGYVFKDENIEEKVKSFIQSKDIPHLLLCGGPGTGKTTLAKILVNALNVLDGDFLYINASNETGVDNLRNKVMNFCETSPFGELKVVLLDEADFLTKNAQGILRVMLEKYSRNVRFILTCNYAHKIISPIQSRLQKFEFAEIDMASSARRLVDILVEEGVTYRDEVLFDYITTFHPDLRKTINELQRGVIDGELGVLNHVDPFVIFDLFMSGKIIEARKEIVKLNMEDNDYHKFYDMLVDKCEELYSGDVNTLIECTSVIARYTSQHERTLDQSLNLASCMGEIMMIIKS